MNSKHPFDIYMLRRIAALLARENLWLWRRQQAFTLKLLAGQLASAADRFCFFANALFRWLFVMATELHFAEDAFTLHLLLKRLERLVYIVVTDENLHACFPVN